MNLLAKSWVPKMFWLLETKCAKIEPGFVQRRHCFWIERSKRIFRIHWKTFSKIEMKFKLFLIILIVFCVTENFVFPRSRRRSRWSCGGIMWSIGKKRMCLWQGTRPDYQGRRCWLGWICLRLDKKIINLKGPMTMKQGRRRLKDGMGSMMRFPG